MIAARGYSREEEKVVTATISQNRNIAVKLDSQAIKFESREIVRDIEKKAAPELKALFKVEEPQPSEASDKEQADADIEGEKQDSLEFKSEDE